MTPVFLDTSAFVALADTRDRHHVGATRLLTRLAKTARPLVTSTDVLDELLTLLRRRVSHGVAVAVGERLLATRWCRVIDVTEDVRHLAWELFVRHDDQPYSFTDCTSFALMRTMHLQEAFTFDRRDFAAAGFTALP